MPERHRSLSEQVVMAVAALLAFTLSNGVLHADDQWGRDNSSVQATVYAAGRTTVELQWFPRIPESVAILRDGNVIARLSGLAGSYRDTGLEPKTRYSYAVVRDAPIVARAAHIPLRPASSVLTVVTAPLLPPRDLSVTVTGPASVEVAWKAVPEATGYIVTRDGLALPSIERATSLRDEGLELGRHVYQVRAIYSHRTPEAMDIAAEDLVSAPGLPVEIDFIWGFADTHAHQFANLAFGGLFVWGKAFDDDGIEFALPACDRWPAAPGWTPRGNHQRASDLDYPPPKWVHGLLGAKNVLGAIVARGGAALPFHDVHGFPTFRGWPGWDSVTHQMMYWEWLKRAYDGGLRLLVVHALNSEFLCSLTWPRIYDCDDMAAVDRQLQEAHDLESFVDGLSGPGRVGWYRIVRTPQEARDAIARNQMAVVLGIEVPDLFGCATNSKKPQCKDPNHPYVEAELQRYYDQGVRHLFPIHSIDNAFGGTALFQDPYWAAQVAITGKPPCTKDCSASGVQFQFNPGKVRGLGLAISDKARRESVRNKGNLPPHPTPGVGYCNRLGLTPAGKALINEMMDRHMIIDIDHMSYQAANDVMDLAEQRGNYPVVSGHAGMIETSIGPGKRHEAQKTAEQLRRIAALAGMGSTFAAEGATARRKHGVVEGIVAYGTKVTKVPNDCSNSSKTFAQAYLYEVDQFGGRDRAAVGLGTDMMGAWIQPGPRFGRKGCSRDGRSDAAEKSKQQKGVIYPFRYQGMPFALDKSEINGRTFNINEDGLAHVGMLPDFIADLLADGLTEADLKPLFRSAEGYIQVWEKASGIRRVVGSPTPPLFLEVDRDHMTDSGGVITVHAADWTTGRAVDGWITLDGQPSGRIGQPIEFAYKSDGRPTLGIVCARGYASETFLLSKAGKN